METILYAENVSITTTRSIKLVKSRAGDTGRSTPSYALKCKINEDMRAVCSRLETNRLLSERVEGERSRQAGTKTKNARLAENPRASRDQKFDSARKAQAAGHTLKLSKRHAQWNLLTGSNGTSWLMGQVCKSPC